MTGLVFDSAAERQRGEDDDQVGFDGVALVVIDRLGLQAALGHAKGLCGDAAVCIPIVTISCIMRSDDCWPL